MRGGEGVHIVYDSGYLGGGYIYMCVYCNAMHCNAMQMLRQMYGCMDACMHACRHTYNICIILYVNK